ncbi:MAG: hypothetical protein ACFFBD_02165 [Candidatus Hodarchaeota archaeon]
MSNQKSNSNDLERDPSLREIAPEVMKKSFVERLLMAFIKRMLFGGVKVLKDKNNIFWGVLTVLILLGTAVAAILLVLPSIYPGVPYLMTQELFQTFIYFQVFVALSFLLVALLRLLNLNTKNLMIITLVLIALSAVISFYFVYLQNPLLSYPSEMFLSTLTGFWIGMFVVWLFIVSVSPFLMARDYLTGLTGKAMWLGASEGRILFGEILKTVFLASVLILALAAFRVLNPTEGTVLFLFEGEKYLFLGVFAITWGLMFYWLFLSNHKLNFVFVTTLVVYYTYSLYHFFLGASPQISNVSGILDVALALLMTLFAVQANARRIDKPNKRIEELPEYRFTKKQLALLMGILSGILGTWSFTLNTLLDLNAGPRVMSFVLHRTQAYFVSFVIIGLSLVFIFLPQYRYVLNYHMSDKEAIKKIWELIKNEIGSLQKQVVVGAAKAITTASLTRAVGSFLGRWVAQRAPSDKDSEKNMETEKN